ncbi:MAG: BolA family protein [Alphaproteobacteria bacterium]
MLVRRLLRAKLAEALDPVRLEIIDESDRHEGHAGARPEGETHFRIEVVSEAFRGKSRLERQRMVHAVLAGEIGAPVHALSLRTLTPEEDKAT